MLLVQLAWRIDEHALYLCSISRLPTIGLPGYLGALVEDWVECSHDLRVINHRWAVGYVYLRGIGEGGVHEEQLTAVQGRIEKIIVSGCVRSDGRFVALDAIHVLIDAGEARGKYCSVRCNGRAFPGTMKRRA